MEKTAKEIAELIGGELSGDGTVRISGVNGINEAGGNEVAFILREEYKAAVDSAKAGCIVIPRALRVNSNRCLIRVDNPSVAFSRIINSILPDRIPHPRGIHPTAIIAKSARLGPGVAAGPYTVVEESAVIEEGSILYPFCYVGARTKVGKGCIFYPNVTLREDVTIGQRVIIHAGSVIGSDGFGYDTQKDGTHTKIPQIGTVVIEDDVEIGSCVTIDRARLDKTVIGRGCKIDNLVQVAHNVRLGPNCIMAAQSGVSGSSSLGKNVILSGQVGIADHVKLGDFCVAGAKTGISKSFPAGTTLFGYPAKPIDKAKERLGLLALLPKLFARVAELEKKVKELEG